MNTVKPRNRRGVSFEHFALECPGMDESRNKLRMDVADICIPHQLCLQDLIFMTSHFQEVCKSYKTPDPYDRQEIYKNTVILKTLKYANKIDRYVEKIMMRQEKAI